jgi:glycosyltransferase involved in cell wall biosynthesis
MKYTEKDHTFVICAYKESEFLEQCIDSLMGQSKKSNIILATSTPNDYIKRICGKYAIPMYINQQPSNIAGDWNFALSNVKTAIATIAHQDDLYKSTYLDKILETVNQCEHPLIAFTDYSEIKNGKEVKNNKLLRIKRKLLYPLRNKRNWKSVFIRRRVLSMGSPICCPSVSYILANMTMPIFRKGFKSDLDWEAWEKISRLPGEFAFANEILMSHRIHGESTTSKIINDEGRGSEDLEMFKKFWPKPIAVMIEKKYKNSEDQNTLN